MKALVRINIILVNLLLITSCGILDDQYKKDIPGSYKYFQTENIENNLVTIDGTSFYGADLSVVSSALLTITIVDETYGSFSLKYNLNSTGTYDIKDTYLIENYPESSIEFNYIRSDNEIENLLSDQISTIMTNQIMPYIKNQMSHSKSEIIDINENYMILSDGTTEYTYNRTTETQKNVTQIASPKQTSGSSGFSEKYLKSEFENIYKDDEGVTYSYESFVVGDLSGDGVDEAVVKYSSSPVDGNFYTQGIVVFYIENGQVYYLDSSLNGFTAMKGSGHFELQKIKNGKLYVELSTYADEDPYCCPSIVENAEYQLTDNGFDKIN